MAYIPKKVSERLTKQTRKYKKILEYAISHDVNESDTVAIIADMLSSIFGFDKFVEITREFAIKGRYCDLAVTVDGSVKFLIEVKAIGLELKESHMSQVLGYGSQHGIQWVVLTNGRTWEIYRISFNPPVSLDLLTSFNFLELKTKTTEDRETLFLLCKEGLSKAVIEEYHKHVQGVNKFMIGAILLSEKGLDFIGRELKRTTPGLSVENDEIHSIIQGEVLKRDILEGDLTDEARLRVKRAASRKMTKRKTKERNQ